MTQQKRSVQGSSSRSAGRPAKARSSGDPSQARAKAAESDDDADEGEGRLDIAESAGYDADSGPLDTGYASESVSLDEVLDDAALDGGDLSVDPEDLGRLALRGAVQQDDVESRSVIRELEREATLEADGAELAAEDPDSGEDEDDDEDDEDDEDDDTLDDDEDEDETEDDEGLDNDDPSLGRAARGDASPERDRVGLQEPTGLDLTQNAIHEGSLFDQPRTDSDDRTRRPLIKTNEVDATLDHNQRAHRSGERIPAPPHDLSVQRRIPGPDEDDS
jgi:hypothetical protein